MKPIRLLVLGTGGMANTHAMNFATMSGVELVAAVDVDQVRVQAFALRHEIARTFTSLDEAIAWGEFDAVTNVTPDKIHYPTTLKLLAAGKHVLCEKPLAEDYAKADEMATAAEKSGLVTMVNLTYRNVAEVQKARQMVLAGEIGRVRHIEASYLQSWLVSKAWGDWATESQWLWRLSTKHGSNGVLGDVGIHILDFAGYGAATDVEHIFARLKTFDKAPGNRIVHASRWAVGHLNELRLRMHGDKGAIEVIHTPDGSTLKACLGDDIEKGIWKDIDAGTVLTNYQRFIDAVRAGKTVEPGFRHAADLQKVLDLAMVTEKERRELSV
jgi:predicted dehydrogenase